MPYVLDSSAMLARIAPDEVLPPSMVTALHSDTAVVPALWLFETINGLEIMRRRKHLDDEALASAINLLVALNVEVDVPQLERNAGPVLALAQDHGLTVYDAAYLELAQRRRLPLATLDDALRKAAKKARIKLV